MKPTIQPPSVSIIISNFNGKDLLQQCLDSLGALDGVKPEIIVVDAGSTDGAPEMVARDYRHVILIRCDNIGIGEALNIGIRKATGDCLIFDLNNDDVVHPQWVKHLVNTLYQSEKIGVVAGKRYQGKPPSRLIDSFGGTINYRTGETPKIGRGEYDVGQYDHPQEVGYTGIIATKRSVVAKVGLLDEAYQIYGEDTDFCLRVQQAGYLVIYSPKAITWHIGSATIGKAPYRYWYYLRRTRVRLLLKLFPFPYLFIPLFWCLVLVPLFEALMLAFVPKRLIAGTKLGRYITTHDFTCLKATIGANLWNIRHLRETLAARKEVQHRQGLPFNKD